MSREILTYLDANSPAEQARNDGRQAALAKMFPVSVELMLRVLDEPEFREGVREVMEQRPWLFQPGRWEPVNDHSVQQMLLFSRPMVGQESCRKRKKGMCK